MKNEMMMNTKASIDNPIRQVRNLIVRSECPSVLTMLNKLTARLNSIRTNNRMMIILTIAHVTFRARESLPELRLLSI